MSEVTVTPLPPAERRSASGAISELRACVYLMDAGYYVYRCESMHAPFDLVAYKDGQCLRVEVKTLSRQAITHTPGFAWPRNDEWDLLVVAGSEVVFCFDAGTAQQEAIDIIRVRLGFLPIAEQREQSRGLQLDDSVRAQILHLTQQGISGHQIADRLGISEYYVYEVRKEHRTEGVPNSKGPRSSRALRAALCSVPKVTAPGDNPASVSGSLSHAETGMNDREWERLSRKWARSHKRHQGETTDTAATPRPATAMARKAAQPSRQLALRSPLLRSRDRALAGIRDVAMTGMKPCTRCHHTWHAHQHLRQGTNCAYRHHCGCRRYRRSRLLALLAAITVLAACGPVTPPPHIHCRTVAGQRQCRPAP